MKEFTLNSADKYKDGSPIMDDLPVQLVRIIKRVKCLENKYRALNEDRDTLIEEYDAVLKTHGDTLEQHTERITINEGNIDALCSDVEDLQEKVYQIYRFLDSVSPDFFAKIQDEMPHKGSDFCGNCTHSKTADGICTCKLNKGIVDPDDSSCPWFEPPFCGNCTHVNKYRAEDGIYACELSGEIIDPDSASCSMFEPPF